MQMPSHGRSQVITLVVDAPARRDARAVMCWALARVNGVDTVGLDLEMARVWVFGNGTVHPLELVDELASCGFAAAVLEHQAQILQ
jgi:hypothetical protein